MNVLLQELAGGIPDGEHLVRAVIRIAISAIFRTVIPVESHARMMYT